MPVHGLRPGRSGFGELGRTAVNCNPGCTRVPVGGDLLDRSLFFEPVAFSLRRAGGTYTGEGEHKAMGGADGLGQAHGPGARL